MLLALMPTALAMAMAAAPIGQRPMQRPFRPRYGRDPIPPPGFHTHCETALKEGETGRQDSTDLSCG